MSHPYCLPGIAASRPGTGAAVILRAPAEAGGGSSAAWTRLPRPRRQREGGALSGGVTVRVHQSMVLPAVHLAQVTVFL